MGVGSLYRARSGARHDDDRMQSADVVINIMLNSEIMKRVVGSYVRSIVGGGSLS